MPSKLSFTNEEKSFLLSLVVNDLSSCKQKSVTTVMKERKLAYDLYAKLYEDISGSEFDIF